MADTILAPVRQDDRTVWNKALAELADPRLTTRLGTGILSAGDAALLSASYRDHSDWSIADAALLAELAAIPGPVIEESEPDPLLFLADGSEVSEIVTMADRNVVQREVDPYAEVQDTSALVGVGEALNTTPMQWRWLPRRGAKASWTIVGDPAQSSWPDLAESERAIAELIGHAPNRTYRLSVNYRSPAEVFSLAAQVVRRSFPEADLPKAVRSTGAQPQLVGTEPESFLRVVAEQAARLLDQVAGTVGVIAPPSRFEAVRATLEPLADNRLVVVTPLQAKGLEYDGVLVAAPDDIVALSLIHI